MVCRWTCKKQGHSAPVNVNLTPTPLPLSYEERGRGLGDVVRYKEVIMSDALARLIAQAMAVKLQYLDYLFGKPNVVACGVGFKIAGDVQTDEPCVVVSVARKFPTAQLAAADLIPKLISQVKTDVVETGVFRAFQNPQQKMRPAQPGISLGHYAITAGTLGCLVQRNGQLFILSNNHVLANVNQAKQGDAILQPGPADGGTAADKIAELADFIPIDFGQAGQPAQPGCATTLWRLIAGQPAQPPQAPAPGGDNHVDCALARPLSPDLVLPDILQIGRPTGAGPATLGTAVQKFGRTTGFTQGQITQIDVTATVDYGGPTALFHSQLMAGAMSQGGDSGSAILDNQKRVVGLLFAGSDTTTLINPIQLVLDALHVQVVT